MLTSFSFLPLNTTTPATKICLGSTVWPACEHVCMCVCVCAIVRTDRDEGAVHTPHPLDGVDLARLEMRLAYPGHGHGESEARTSLGCSGCSAITSVGPSW